MRRGRALDGGGILPALLRHRAQGNGRPGRPGLNMTTADSPIDQFKRSTAATLRAIAEREDVTVTYASEPPGISGTKARLSLPPRVLPADVAAQVRGAADAIGLRLKHHDPALHAKRSPI